MKVKKYKIKDLKPADYNPRYLTDKAEADLMESLKRFGLIDPIIININDERKNIVIGGHQRLKIWTKLGNEDIDCVELDLTEEQERELNVRLNKNTGDFDILMLKQHFEIDDLITWGFEDFELGLEDFGTDDGEQGEKKDRSELDKIEVEIDEEDIRVKAGEVWQLGGHKLLCGDALKPKELRKLFGKKKANLTFTDPPYGMKKENDGVANDNLNFDKLLEFNKVWVKNSFDFLTPNGSWYCWGIDEPLMDIYSDILKPMARANEVTFRNLITWDKGNGQGQNSENTRMYAVADEKCLFVMNGVAGFDTNSYNYYEGYEPIREYFIEEFRKVGGDKAGAEVIGVTKRMVEHYTKKSQWDMMSRDRYEVMQKYCQENKIDAFKDYGKIKAEYDKIKKVFNDSRAYFNNTHDNFNNVWHFSRTSNDEKELTGGHATPKPIELCERGILSSSQKGDIVADYFGGSGSTLIACELNDRICYMNELEPYWCEVIIRRYEKLTGETAVKL
jgi:DNA modification methylase